jgi:hypothetical protein
MMTYRMQTTTLAHTQQHHFYVDYTLLLTGTDVTCTMRPCLSLQNCPLDKMGKDTYPTTTYHLSTIVGYVPLMWRILLIQDSTLLKLLYINFCNLQFKIGLCNSSCSLPL